MSGRQSNQVNDLLFDDIEALDKFGQRVADDEQLVVVLLRFGCDAAHDFEQSSQGELDGSFRLLGHLHHA